MTLTQSPHLENDALEAAILSTVAYRDIFDFPMTLDEIHRYLHWQQCSVADVAETLAKTELCHGRLATDGRYYCLANREWTLDDRHVREARAEQKMQVALRIARLLSHLPHIRMIAITGSLAARNCYEGSDIDFFCVTSEGRMWQARALVLVVARWDAMTRKRGICANYFASTRAIEFDNQSMYIAQELSQMVPVYGHDIYEQIRAQNGWTSRFLPNGSTPPMPRIDVSVHARAKRAMEGLVAAFTGSWLETFERTRKMRRFNDPSFMDGTHSPFTADRTGHDQRVGKRIEAAWQARFGAIRPQTAPDHPVETR